MHQTSHKPACWISVSPPPPLKKFPSSYKVTLLKLMWENWKQHSTCKFQLNISFSDKEKSIHFSCFSYQLSNPALWTTFIMKWYETSTFAGLFNLTYVLQALACVSLPPSQILYYCFVALLLVLRLFSLLAISSCLWFLLN